MAAITAGTGLVERGLREEANDKRYLGAPDVEIPVATTPSPGPSSCASGPARNVPFPDNLAVGIDPDLATWTNGEPDAPHLIGVNRFVQLIR